MSRFIYDDDPDPAKLFTELYDQGVRDDQGLPLGNIEAHAQRRLAFSYGVLELCALVRDEGAIEPITRFAPEPAGLQDKQAGDGFEAAHALPCDIAVEQPGLPDRLIHDLLRNGFNREWVRRNIFAATDRVNRLVNYADRICERGQPGMARVLAGACQAIARGEGSPTGLMEGMIIPRYAQRARERLDRLEQGLSAFEQQELSVRPIVDRLGRPFTPRPADTRMTSPDATARAANKQAVRQTLAIYAAATRPDVDAVLLIRNQLAGLRHNERFA